MMGKTMCKKVLSLVLALLIPALSIPVAVAEDSVEIGGQCGENAYWKLDDQGKMTIFGSGEVKPFAPRYEDGKVYASGLYDTLWRDNGQIRTIEIREGISSIGFSAFQSLYNLTEVTLPESLERIEEEAFSWCSCLREIRIPKGVASIADSAFAHNQLQFITVDAENPNYRNDAAGALLNEAQTLLLSYPSKSENKAYAVPDTVQRIAPYAFERAYALREITLPDGLAVIGDGAFQSCYIGSVTIPASVTAIGQDAFDENPYLSRIDVAAGNTAYVSSAEGVLFTKDGTRLIRFPGACELSTYTVPDGVKTIDGYAFYSARLRTVSLPAGLETIGDCAFYYCTNLTRLNIPSSVKRLPFYGFANCYTLESVSIPSGVEEIGQSAFAYSENLRTVSISKTVAKIEENAFGDCPCLERFSVSAENPSFSADGGVLFNKSKTVLIQFPVGKSSKKYTVPNTVKTIGGGAFRNAALESILLPDSLRTIEEESFAGCRRIKAISIPDGVFTIDSWSFEYCDLLESVSVPFSVRSINSSTFYGCGSLSDVFFNGTEAEWHDIEVYNRSTGHSITGNAALHFSDCAHTRTETVPAAESASCTQPGHTAGKRCADCGRWIVQPTDTVKAHTDANDDGVCDLCGALVTEIKSGDIFETTIDPGETKRFRFIPEKDGIYEFELISAKGPTGGFGWSDSFNDPSSGTYRSMHEYYLCAGNAYELWFRSSEYNDVPAVVKFTLIPERTCGKYIWYNTWYRNEPYTALEINGIGDMWDYSEMSASWDEPDKIQTVHFYNDSFYQKREIRSISAEAFAGMSNVQEIYNYNDNLVTASVFKDIASDFTVYCNKDSAEHRYCAANGIPYVLTNVEDHKEHLVDEGTGVGIDFYPDSFDAEDVSLHVETVETHNENAFCWEIAPVDAEGNKVQPNRPVQIRLPLPAGWNQKPLLITHTHDDGEVELITSYTFDGDSVLFWVSGFSKFEIAVQEETPHVHSYDSAVTTVPTCTQEGVETFTCVDGDDSYTLPIPALGHIDDNNDGRCDRDGCGEKMTGGAHCPKCGRIHNKNFFDAVIGFFHRLGYRVAHFFASSYIRRR